MIKKLLYSVYLKTVKIQYTSIYSSIEDSEVVLVSERNNADWKKLPNSLWTDKWLVCLPKCHVSFKICTQVRTEFFISHISIRINSNGISEGLLYLHFLILHLHSQVPFNRRTCTNSGTASRTIQRSLATAVQHTGSFLLHFVFMKSRTQIWS
jgi:hypothetical protein